MNKIVITLLLFYACSKGEIQDFSPEAFVFNRSEDLGETVCVIGDAGHGRTGQYLVGKALVLEKCERVWYVGDIIYPRGLKNTEDPSFQSRFYKPYEDLIRSSWFKQFHMALGNHDYDGNIWVWRDLAKKYSYLSAPSLYYMEKFGSLCFWVLDSNHYMRDFDWRNQKEQKLWLKHQWSQYEKSCQTHIAFAHHPYRSSGLHGDASPALKRFYEENILGKMDLFITGHDHHQSDEGKEKGTQLLITGTGGEFRTTRKKPYQGGYQSSKLGFLKLKFQNGETNFEFITVEPGFPEPKTNKESSGRTKL